MNAANLTDHTLPVLDTVTEFRFWQKIDVSELGLVDEQGKNNKKRVEPDVIVIGKNGPEPP